MIQHNPHISAVSPVYGAASLLPELAERIGATLSAITENYEIILVEDNSPDESWQIITRLAAADERIKGVRLSRNFGQQNAINAGLDQAKGEWVVTLDCDLQDAPENITSLYNKAQQGYDIVFAGRKNRQDSWGKMFASRIFYKILGYLSETELDHSIANFVLYNRKAIDAMRSLGDYYRYYPMINRWIGFQTTVIEVDHNKRKDEKRSSYSFRKRMILAMMTIMAFSDKPLRIVMKFGIGIVMLSMLLAIVLVVRYLFMGITVSGWLSIFISIWLLSGIIIMILGIIGMYLGKVFETVKRRPSYIISEKINT